MSTTTLTFSTSSGQPQPQSVTVASATAGAAVNFTAAVSSQGNWLTVYPTSGTTPTTLQAGVGNINSFASGTYTGTITITPAGTGATPVMVSATLYVGTSVVVPTGSYTASPTALNFSLATGTGSSTQNFTLSTTSAGGTVNLSSSATWLTLNQYLVSVTPTSAPTIAATVTPGSMPAGTYNATITATPAGTTTAVLAIPVTLTLSGTGTGGISTNPASLTFTFANGATAATSQTVQVSTVGFAPEPITVAGTTLTGTGWLTVTPTGTNVLNPTASTPQSINVIVNPSSLAANTSYTGQITLTSQDYGSITVPITVTEGTGSTGTGTLSASPTSLTMNAQVGTTVPVNQSVTVSSSTATTLTAAVSGIPWVSVNPVSVNIGSGSSQVYTVSATPTGIAAGSYSGFIVITPSSGSPLDIPLTVNIGTASQLSVTPGTLNFAYQTGTSFPAAQTLAISSTGTSLSFSVAASTQNGGSWLVVSPTSGATSSTTAGAPSPITVQVNPSSLTPGSYQGSITVTASGASNSSMTIPVSLLVSSQPILSGNPGSVTFNYQFGSTTQPAQQQVQLTSSGNPLQFSASIAPGSSFNFVNLTPSSGTTPQTLSISINPTAIASLAPGTYTNTVAVTAPGSGNNTFDIPVVLTITNNTLLTTSQSSVNFNYEIGQALPVSQTFNISSSGGPLSYTATANSTNCSQSFLSANSNASTTPGTVAVSVNVQGLVAGTCNGNITITSPGAGNSPLVIPVTVLVSTTPLMNVSPSAINVTAQAGTSPASQNVAVTSTDPTMALPFTVTSSTTSGGSSWLLVGPTSGTTPSNLTVGFQTAGLPVGTYTGSIIVSPTTSGIPPTTIPVTLVVTSSAIATVSPTALTFTQPFGSSAPAAQTLMLTSPAPGLTFSATATTLNGTGSWLSVTPTSGTTPGTLMVTANGSGLGQGSYTGVVTILIPGAANSPINVQVTLNVTPAVSLTATPSTLNFTYQAGGTAPTAQNVVVTSASSTSLPFTVATASSVSGLITASPTSGNTPGTIGVGFNSAILSTLAAGTYNGTVTITTQNGGSQTVMVSLTVTAAPPPAINTIVNSASNTPGAVSPGEIISIYGLNIGPATAAGLQLTSAGGVATSLGGTTVTFDNTPAPLIYVSANQINAIVPYEIAGRVTTNVTITRAGMTSSALQLVVANSAPAIFSLNQGGSGPGAILNADSSVNSAQNPAAKGTVVQIFATGEGALTPAVATGTVTSANGPTFPKPIGAVSVTIGGVPATVVYAGEAPGEVSGLLQVNAIIPQGVGSGAQQVMLNVGGNTNAQQNITAAVQ